jgi:hypothetical protein
VNVFLTPSDALRELAAAHLDDDVTAELHFAFDAAE